ncbi:4-hydroxythreonine-4-phosphate dehydrogenase PdxA [Prevotella sp. E13-17]|uniref:4-hydroxythreonine-4-phosphate dehydrogenase PdxA n=1 Tax=Prevotella sp. E13-17 TaxID=2913616 RepID=UPI001EDC69B5|nr:4-hydroxythreonine-4-phosphate dehydrogenase PdxA [Prevotella sp. E13-17]UKK51824.1 4-hydroxythreonine-4-phosphate dehydrogenase PdxA [Prevotella sp. E13-17]
MEEKKIRVAITHGDTNGVGYEVILKAFEDPAMLELCTPIIYGSSKLAEYHGKMLEVEPHYNVIKNVNEARDGHLNLLEVINGEVKVDLGTPTPEAGEAAKVAIDRAIEDYKKGAFDVLVTAPVFKNSIGGFNGHTSYIERQMNDGKKGLTILMNDGLRVALVTNHVAIKDVAESITKQKIVEKTILFHESLRRDLRIANPRIAILALNPRCGEDGALGDEEQEIIVPAVEELAEKSIQAFGPYAADDFFGHGSYSHFDGVLAMYHDQGQTPFKTLTPENGVRFTTGLDIVRTAPAHGAYFNLAGRNEMDAQSMRNAIYAALDIYRNRHNYDEPLANPLPKLYHEKRDESEKVRFRSQPKKEQNQ